MASSVSLASAEAPSKGFRQLPEPVNQAFRLARYQFRDFLRSQRFVLMMSIVAAVAAIIIGIVGYFRPAGFISDSATFYDTFWGTAVTIVIVFAGVIFGGDAIAGEFQNKTGYFLMGQPIRRASVYIGKYLAAFAASVIAVVFYLALIVGDAAYYFGGNAISLTLLASFGLALLYLLALLGATFLFSSMFKTSLYGVLVVAIMFLFGFMLLQDAVLGLAHVQPWFIISYADSVIGGVFNSSCMTNPGMHTCATMGPGGQAFMTTVNNATIPLGIEIMLGYFAVMAIAGLGLFERQEFT